MTIEDTEKDLSNALAEMEKQLGHLMTLIAVYNRLSRDGKYPEHALIDRLCNHIHKLHDAFYRAWPLMLHTNLMN